MKAREKDLVLMKGAEMNRRQDTGRDHVFLKLLISCGACCIGMCKQPSELLKLGGTR